MITLEPVALGYSVLGRARATEVVPVIFGIQQRCSVAQLSRVVDAVSALDSPSYGRYVSLVELNAACANPAATEAVVALRPLGQAMHLEDLDVAANVFIPQSKQREEPFCHCAFPGAQSRHELDPLRG